uniref:Deoxyribodipyrimidine photo-lyase n=1 Tax=Dictyoglomus thermophilum TaxID=14 RepID=A0A7C3MKP5_DICTH
MDKERIRKINNKDINKNGKFVLYYMSLSQREDQNHSLEFSVYLSNQLKKPLVVYFPISDMYKFSNIRYYRFMLEGILKTKKNIEERGIQFIIEKINPPYKKVINSSQNYVAVILDKGYLRHPRKINKEIADNSEVSVFEIESDVIVPIEIASSKQETYASTIRPKIFNLLNIYLKPLEKLTPKVKSYGYDFGFNPLSIQNVDEILKILSIDNSVSTVEKYFKGGSDEAEKRLKDFIENKLYKYKELRSNPAYDYQSNLSPYLHFGQISPIKIVLEVLKNYDFNDENVQSFFNELIIWRELARNFCYYNPFYNQYQGIPEWAKYTLEQHLSDKRDYIYNLEDLEKAKTHDIYWNTAQKELLKTGKMHGYMRMYWAKKVIEWTLHPKRAFDFICYLNDKYSLDGRDPNGYSGISWCLGSHDRPFQERKIFGKVRYMSKRGLEEKFDIKKYIERVNNI